MSKLVNQTYAVEIELQIARQCAPVLLGIKTANLLVLREHKSDYVIKLFWCTELKIKILCNYESKDYYLIYHPGKLAEYIHRAPILNYLYEVGYTSENINSIIQMIAYKYSRYMLCKQGFPHEIGLLLGYPLEDVLSFVKQKGNDYIYSGYWKVYDHLTEALLTFWQYKKAKEILVEFILHGGNLPIVINEIIKYEVKGLP